MYSEEEQKLNSKFFLTFIFWQICTDQKFGGNSPAGLQHEKQNQHTYQASDIENEWNSTKAALLCYLVLVATIAYNDAQNFHNLLADILDAPTHPKLENNKQLVHLRPGKLSVIDIT